MSSATYSRLSLREPVIHPDGKETLLDRVKDFHASDELTITRDGDTYIVTGKTRSLEVPAGVVLFAVRTPELAKAFAVRDELAVNHPNHPDHVALMNAAAAQGSGLGRKGKRNG